jgi:hypothetical protein
MHTAELVGYLASALVFATFYMKTMMPLRGVAIASNVAFISYGYVGGMAPILILHVALLSLNLSASNAARDRNSPIKAHQINLQRSLIDRTINRFESVSQLFWVCGRDRPFSFFTVSKRLAPALGC